MSTPHKHAELIKAWADGAYIEGQDITGEWFITFHPDWRRDGPYRVYKEPKPDVVRYGVAFVKLNLEDFGGVKHFGDENLNPLNNLKLTFNGETGELKSAERI